MYMLQVWAAEWNGGTPGWIVWCSSCCCKSHPFKSCTTDFLNNMEHAVSITRIMPTVFTKINRKYAWA